MKFIQIPRRRARRVRTCAPDLFDWARQQDLLAHHSILTVSRIGVSPALALAYAELSSLSKEARGD